MPGTSEPVDCLHAGLLVDLGSRTRGTLPETANELAHVQPSAERVQHAAVVGLRADLLVQLTAGHERRVDSDALGRDLVRAFLPS